MRRGSRLTLDADRPQRGLVRPGCRVAGGPDPLDTLGRRLGLRRRDRLCAPPGRGAGGARPRPCLRRAGADWVMIGMQHEADPRVCRCSRAIRSLC